MRLRADRWGHGSALSASQKTSSYIGKAGRSLISVSHGTARVDTEESGFACPYQHTALNVSLQRGCQNDYSNRVA
jgi:hypothetical protein